MSTWKPISTAPKDGTEVDLWSSSMGRCCDAYYCPGEDPLWLCGAHGIVRDVTHWREPDKGPGMEEGEVRWMVEGSVDLISSPLASADAAAKLAHSMNELHESEPYRVVRVRILREDE